MQALLKLLPGKSEQTNNKVWSFSPNGEGCPAQYPKYLACLMVDCRVPQRGGSINIGRAKETKGEFVLDVPGLGETSQMGANCNLLGPKDTLKGEESGVRESWCCLVKAFE